MRLEGKSIVITGATGIAASGAERFACDTTFRRGGLPVQDVFQLSTPGVICLATPNPVTWPGRGTRT